MIFRKNLFELPLIETPTALSEEVFFDFTGISCTLCAGGSTGGTFDLQGGEACIVSPGYLC